jgi:hypothetical protein
MAHTQESMSCHLPKRFIIVSGNRFQKIPALHSDFRFLLSALETFRLRRVQDGMQREMAWVIANVARIKRNAANNPASIL